MSDVLTQDMRFYDRVVTLEILGPETIGIQRGELTPDLLAYLREHKAEIIAEQQDTILYNSQITISDIPAQAYEYVVNGKSAIEWVMERYQVTVHRESGIRNDPNEWAEEVGNPRYILDLLLSVIHVSVQTGEIVAGLPAVKFD